MSRSAFLLVLALALPAPPPASPASTGSGDPSPEGWVALKPLVGRWVGEGSGFGAVSDVQHEWTFVIQGHFLELRTRSTQRAEAGVRPEVHEDIGLMSRDTDQDRFVFRQFLSEGFVNTFDVAAQPGGGPTLLFEHRESEGSGGMRARMRLTFNGADEYEMTLDLAGPGKDFKTCQRMHMHRARPAD